MAINLSSSTKWIIYAALNLAVWIALPMGAAVGGGSLGELPYVLMLFALCSSPIPFINRLNGAYSLLGVAMAHHFVEFGLLDFVSMFSPPKAPHLSAGLLTPGELVILMAGGLKILGFHLAARFLSQRPRIVVPMDWPRQALVPIGLFLWLAGTALTVYQALYLQIDNSDMSVSAAYAKLGPWGTDAYLLITNYAGPLGIMVLAYWWAVWGRGAASALMLFIIAVQFVAGWVVDTKEVAISAPLIMILTRFITLGRVPTRWVVGAMLGIVLVFPVMTAKRIIVTEGLHMTRSEALAHVGEILLRSIEEQDLVRKGGKYDQRSQSFLERATDKAAVEVFVAHIGIDKPYKMGATLDQLLYVFIPRVVWSGKPGENSSQTFNRDFHLSEDPDTHISPTHIGELYWNFGYFGVIFGMTFFGLLLGYVCVRFDPSIETSITRVLVIIVTLYNTVIGGGGQIELAYVLWIRILLIIGILHLVIARPVMVRSREESMDTDAIEFVSTRPMPVRFENLLR